MSNKLQHEIKSLVDDLLKRTETKSLRYTKVSIKDERGIVNVYIKIYLEAPMRMSTLNELIKNLSSKYGASMESFLIYSPHARAIRISFSVKK